MASCVANLPNAKADQLQEAFDLFDANGSGELDTAGAAKLLNLLGTVYTSI
jgi:Ca2+-binding EF-hand superfamily protein